MRTALNSSNIMSHDFSPSPNKPNPPLRRPATGPGFVNPSIQTPVFNDHGTLSPQERSLVNSGLDAARNMSGLVAARDNIGRGPGAAPVTVKLCNYCSKQGDFRCTRCKKTCYCSVACQTEDWKAHRHICKPSISENCASNKPKESQTLNCGNGPNVLDSKGNIESFAQPKRVFMQDLRKNNITKGDEVHGSVVELMNPGKFFIHIQSVEMTETLKNITRELQMTYGSVLAAEYKPEVGEICAVKFSLDQKWYRAEVVSIDVGHNSAKVLYIDFGNEENVTLDKICSLAANIDTAPPCALQCCIAGVTSVSSSWTGECCIALRNVVAGKNLTFTVLDIISSTVFVVDAPLFTFGRNLSTFLIEQGYAMKEDASMKPQTKQDINFLIAASFENFKRLSDGKNENVEAQPPEPLSQEMGDIFTAVVTHLNSPSEIICQKFENASIIQQLQRGIREHCTKTQASDSFRPAPGTICCSIFSEDNQWYRAKVLAYSSEDRVCVGYIDFGNSEEVKLNHLRPIGVDLLALATQAIPCSLAGIKPNSDSWSEEVIVMLKQLVCNRFIRVEILGKRDGMALVSMIDESSDPQTNVAELLVATGYAAVGGVELKEKADGLSGIYAETEDKLELSCVELPIDGQKVALVISVLENPGEFFCYKYNAGGSTGDMQSLDELSSALIKHCETDGTPFNPVVGEPCCALFRDGSWNRSIVQTVGDGKCQVYFVDYGNTYEVEAAHLRVIKPSLLKHPFQAIRCWLAEVEPLGAEWSKDAVHRFQALCVGKQLSARVLAITEKGYGVELECSGHNVASVLISEKLAKAIGHENGPAAQADQSSDRTEASDAPTVPAKNSSLTDQPCNITVTKPASPQSVSVNSFPLDWKTVKLLDNGTFQPQVVAVTSPSLFYVMNPTEVNVERLQTVMTDVARYCSSLTMPSKNIPLPGAACCAQFSVDKNWYRAVVLDTTSTQASVIYADYGNIECVPISSLLPIPNDLLQPPFQIARCALSGKEHFPTVWPLEILELFSIQLSGKIQASIQGFDGSCNLLTLTEVSGQGGSSISSIIMDALQKVNARSSTEMQALAQEHMQADCTVMASGNNMSADTEKPKPLQQIENLKTMISVKNEELQSVPGSKDHTSCCCASLEQKITQIQELLLLLIKQIDEMQTHCK